METTLTKGARSEAGIASPTANDLGQVVQATRSPRTNVEGFDLPDLKALTRQSRRDERFSFSNDGCGS